MDAFDPNRWKQRNRQDAWIARNSHHPYERQKKSVIPYAVAPWVVIACFCYVCFS